MTIYLALLLGLAAASLGGELFVRGTVGLASVARISPGIIAATVAAFATSSPELTVAISSALAGSPAISMGDALGSNVANVALILAIALVIAPMSVPRSSVRRDFPMALLSPLLLGALVVDGTLSRGDGILLLAVFATWLVLVVGEARRQRSVAPRILGEAKPVRAIGESVLGLALLVAAGKLIVFGATGVARDFGLSEFAIGATVVAVGTSMPELAVAVVSRLRGHDEVGLGTVLGSNIFNGLFIIGVAAVITPIVTPHSAIFLPIALGVAVVAFTFPSGSGTLGRWRGGLLLLIYIAYVVAVLRSGMA